MSTPVGPIDYCLVPLQAPPAGQVSNFVNPTDLVTTLIVISTIFTAISVVFLAGRFIQNAKKMKVPDYLAIVGFILSTGYTGVVIGMRDFSRHAWDVPMCWYLADSAWQLLFASNILLGPTQFFVKMVILLLYFQLFATTRATKMSIIAASVFAGVIYLVHPILVVAFEAPRPGQTWSEPGINGMSAKLTYYAPIHGIGSVILDIWILLIPIPAISKLQVSRKKRIELFIIFVTGFLGVISSIISCYWRFQLLLDHPGDSTWFEGQLFGWIIIEHNVALMVGSMPAFAGMIKTHAPGSLASIRSKWRGDSSSSGYSGNSSLPISSKTPSSFRSASKDEVTETNDFYELHETTSYDSRTALGKAPQIESKLPPTDEEDEDEGIRRTTNFEQQSYHHRSLDGNEFECFKYAVMIV